MIVDDDKVWYKSSYKLYIYRGAWYSLGPNELALDLPIGLNRSLTN